MLAEYQEVSKYFGTDADKFEKYKAEKYKNIEATTKFQTEERSRLQTEGPNSNKNIYEVMWDSAEVGGTLELIGKGKHPRKVHLGKTNKRKISRDFAVTAKKHRNEGKTYMSKRS